MEKENMSQQQKIQELESEIERLNRVIDIKNGEIENVTKYSKTIINGA